MSMPSTGISAPPRRAADPAICTRAVRVDPDSGMAIWELRDPLTGRILKQFPSARSIAAYRRRLGDDAA